MNQQALVASLLVCLLSVVAVKAQDRNDQDALPRDQPQVRRGRLLERRRTKHQTTQNTNNKINQKHERELEGITYNTELSFGPDDPSSESQGESPCQAIIAIDGWRNLSTNSTIDEDIDFYRYMDINLDYIEASRDVPTDEDFVCELTNGDMVPIQGTNEQLSELRVMLNNGTLISSETSVKAEAAEGISHGGAGASPIVTLPAGDIQLVNNNNRKRRLQNGKNRMYEGHKKILVLRVTDKKGRSVGGNAWFLSDKFFGTSGDSITMKSGFEACSFGKLVMSNDYGDYWNNHFRSNGAFSAPGVVEVKIDIELDKSTQSEILNAAQSAALQKMQIGSLNGVFDHSIFVLERCYPVGTNCAFAAYAYTNHWLSVYFGDNYKYPAVVMHELGHNSEFLLCLYCLLPYLIFGTLHSPLLFCFDL